MKISIFIKFFPPKHIGGAEIAAYNIAKYFTKKGNEVHVITSRDKGCKRLTFEEGFYVHSLYWLKIKFFGGFLFWINVFLQLRKIKPNIIHFQCIDIGIFAVFLMKILKKPYVVWGQGSDIYQSKFFNKKLLKVVIKNADGVIAMNQDMQQKIKKMYNRDIFIVPTGIDLKRFNNLSRKEIRASLNLKNDEKIILFIGNLRPVKGVIFLIQAMKFIIDKNMNVRLFIVGSGEERKNLENIVKKYDLQKYVTFFGRVSNLKISENIVASDLFVLPSLSEGFPLVILEAMASGLPIIASNVGGLSEIIKDFENGFLVKPKNPEKIAEKVIFLLNDEKLRKTISKNNKEEAKKYCWKNVIEKLENIYFKLTNNV